MKIEIHVSRKHLVIGVLLIAILFGVGTVKAQGEPPFIALEQQIEDLTNQVATLQEQVDTLSGVPTEVETLQQNVATLEELLIHFSRTDNDIYLTGANLHVVNGDGSTYIDNSLGNIIIGYNELRVSGNDRTGSHMLVVGSENNFSTHGGIVVGYHNSVTGDFASVSGGRNNTASGYTSSVSGGWNSSAIGMGSSVSGGEYNVSYGGTSSVSGGHSNTASNYGSSVGGGYNNTASYSYSTVGGGTNLTTTALYQFLP